MDYKKQNFTDGQALTAAQLNHMEHGIEELGTEVSLMSDAFGDIDTALDAIIAIQNELLGYSTFTLYHTTDVTGEKSTYYYKEGMTWREWVASEYNVDGFDFDEADELRTTDGKYVNYTMEPVDGKLYIDDCVHPDTIIDPGKYFYSLG